MKFWILWVTAVATTVFGGAHALAADPLVATTTIAVVDSTYDASGSARAGVPNDWPDLYASSLASRPVEGSAPFPPQASGASTTLHPRIDATNTVDDLLSSGRQVTGRFPNTANADEVLLRRGADGSVTHYQIYGPDGLPVRRVDVTGASHAGVPTPHVLEFERHVNPTTGQVFVRPADTVRPALPGEIPGAG